MSANPSAMTRLTDARGATADLVRQFGDVAPSAIVFFCSHRHDGAEISKLLRQRYPAAEVIGCTSAGEFIERDGSEGGVSAIAFASKTARRAFGALARFDHGVTTGIDGATRNIAARLGSELRALDASRYTGVVLFEGLHMREEDANIALGAVAPQLGFVGGSAGDNLEFKHTAVFYNGEQSDDGAALLVLDMAVPFTITKTSALVPTKHRFTITRADVENRVIYELDGRPAADVYAEAVGTTPDKLGSAVFMKHPFGQILDDDPWIRSPQQILPGGAIKFYAQIPDGAEIHVMQSTDIVAETHAAMQRAKKEVGGKVGGALLFNCILRRLELDADKAHERFREAFAGYPVAGFHTYGETYLGHVNQTCTGLVFA